MKRQKNNPGIQLYSKVLLFFFAALGNGFAQIPAGYYDPAVGLSGTALKQALHNIIDNHSIQSYNSLHTHYNSTDKKTNGKVWDMYSDNPSGTAPYEFTFGTTCGSYNSEADCYNREHSFPKSWFNDLSPMYTDLFHVYPTDGYVNEKRSNYPYGEVTTASFTSQNGSKLGTCSYPGYSGTVFEPIDEYKGDFARTYFYMCTRYYGEDSGWITTGATTGANLKAWANNMLVAWHTADPVSAKETARNNAVYSIQGNRNPYIDHPEYVASVFPNMTFPVPIITSITPDNVNAGESTFTIIVSGSNFIAESVVRWNGVNRATSFVNANQLTATILWMDLVNAGTANVSVYSLPPGGGTSANSSFKINNNTTGVTDFVSTSSFSFEISPNPADEIVEVAYFSNSTGLVQINVLDVYGKCVMKAETKKVHDELKLTLDVQDLNRGIYFLSIVDESTSSIKKMVLQ